MVDVLADSYCDRVNFSLSIWLVQMCMVLNKTEGFVSHFLSTGYNTKVFKRPSDKDSPTKNQLSNLLASILFWNHHGQKHPLQGTGRRLKLWVKEDSLFHVYQLVSDMLSILTKVFGLFITLFNKKRSFLLRLESFC